MKNMVKLLMVIVVAFAGVCVSGSGVASASKFEVQPNYGQYPVPIYDNNVKYRETIYITNTDLGIYGAGAGGVSTILERKSIFSTLAKVFVYAGAASAIAAAINHGAGNNGFKVVITYDYKLHRDNPYQRPYYTHVPVSWSVTPY
ncbi:hypothetical protein [Bhargavaea massiliensis]|uniref:hypothetical protein n=1 Tax=Bhargavaea massiliensis TaxID=2697500 RepID=UPI001BCC4D82|nr:hypothetical protein [Bhargavaea massiliensis]